MRKHLKAADVLNYQHTNEPHKNKRGVIFDGVKY